MFVTAHGTPPYRIRLERYNELLAARGWKSDADLEVATAIGVNRSTVSRIRRQVMTPGTEFMFKAAEFFDVPINDLFEKTPAKKATKKPQRVAA